MGPNGSEHVRKPRKTRENFEKPRENFEKLRENFRKNFFHGAVSRRQLINRDKQMVDPDTGLPAKA